MTRPICTNCKWSKESFGSQICHAPHGRGKGHFLVGDPATEADPKYCFIQRTSSGWFWALFGYSKCGTEGRWFESRVSA